MVVVVVEGARSEEGVEGGQPQHAGLPGGAAVLWPRWA